MGFVWHYSKDSVSPEHIILLFCSTESFRCFFNFGQGGNLCAWKEDKCEKLNQDSFRVYNYTIHLEELNSWTNS
jgi:hypothetical protein